MSEDSKPHVPSTLPENFGLGWAQMLNGLVDGHYRRDLEKVLDEYELLIQEAVMMIPEGTPGRMELFKGFRDNVAFREKVLAHYRTTIDDALYKGLTKHEDPLIFKLAYKGPE